jgi:hypothetical protein
LVTAPTVEKRTKLAATPNGGACAKFSSGIKSSIIAVNALNKIVFMLIQINS